MTIELSTSGNQETEQTTSPSEDISYVETRKFLRSTCVETRRLEYPSVDAFTMYRKVIEKYKATDQAILICLRDKDDQLVRSELLNYPRETK